MQPANRVENALDGFVTCGGANHIGRRHLLVRLPLRPRILGEPEHLATHGFVVAPCALLQLFVRQVSRQRVAELALEELGPQTALALGARRNLVAEAAAKLVDSGVGIGLNVAQTGSDRAVLGCGAGRCGSLVRLGHALVDEVVDATRAEPGPFRCATAKPGGRAFR